MPDNNSLEITKQNLMEAELLCGYKYLDIYNTGELNLANAEQALSNKKRQRDSFIDNIKYENIDWKKSGTVSARYDEYCKQARSSADNSNQSELNNYNAEKDRLQKSIKKSLLHGLLFLVLAFIGLGLFGLGAKFLNSDNGGLGGVCCGTGSVMIVVCGGISGFIFYSRSEDNKKLSSLVKPVSISAYIESFETYVNQNFTNEQLEIYYRQMSGNKLARFDADIDNLQKTVETNKNSLLKLKQTEGKWIEQNLQVLPVPYFTYDAVSNMLYFYLCDRADTMRDLINMYEEKKFRDELISSVKSVAVAINRLSDSINSNFNRLGLQLGVINNTITENAKLQKVNSDKLSSIKDANSRHYMEMADRLSRLESTTYINIDTVNID